MHNNIQRNSMFLLPSLHVCIREKGGVIVEITAPTCVSSWPNCQTVAVFWCPILAQRTPILCCQIILYYVSAAEHVVVWAEGLAVIVVVGCSDPGLATSMCLIVCWSMGVCVK